MKPLILLLFFTLTAGAQTDSSWASFRITADNDSAWVIVDSKDARFLSGKRIRVVARGADPATFKEGESISVNYHHHATGGTTRFAMLNMFRNVNGSWLTFSVPVDTAQLEPYWTLALKNGGHYSLPQGFLEYLKRKGRK